MKIIMISSLFFCFLAFGAKLKNPILYTDTSEPEAGIANFKCTQVEFKVQGISNISSPYCTEVQELAIKQDVIDSEVRIVNSQAEMLAQFKQILLEDPDFLKEVADKLKERK